MAGAGAGTPPRDQRVHRARGPGLSAGICVDLYGSYATSFFPLQDAQPDGETLKPILGRQVEFGQRFHLPARIDINTAFYYQVRENYAFARPGGVFDQASEVWSRGFELDVTTAPSANWRINGGYAFTHAELGDYLLRTRPT